MGHTEQLTDTAWMCINKNASTIAGMPPYTTTGGKVAGSRSWMANPDPDLYTSWFEFAKQLFWDYQLGEAFVVCTSRFADGYPARFHVIEPWLVNVEMGASGRRLYDIGGVPITDDLLHIRYKSTTSAARGVGPLDAGHTRVVAARMLQRYALNVVSSGGVPYYVMKHPDELTHDQVTALQSQWFESRMNSLGMPAILSGGIEIETMQISPNDMSLVDLSRHNDSRIAVMLGVPPVIVGLPSGADSMTYNNMSAAYDDHWRSGLSPLVEAITSALSGWALPNGTDLEVNKDDYVRPDAYTRAQTQQIYVAMGVLTVADVQQLERFALTGNADTLGVLT
jgi:HK97 family phage portal protein